MHKKVTVKDINSWTSFEQIQEYDFAKLYGSKFVWNLLPFLAIQKPQKTAEGKYSAKSIINRLATEEYTVPDNDGWDFEATISGKTILALWKFFYTQSPKQWLTTSQTKNTSIASGTPIIMYAYKHQHNIPYNAWDRRDPNLRYLLTENLKWLLDPPPIPEELITESTLTFHEMREHFLTTGTTGVVNSPTNPKASMVPGLKEFNKLPKYQRYMYFQTWIYHPSIRSDNMITDWDDWDAVRPSRDGSYKPPNLTGDLDW
jgi:hypothetical protein